MAAKVTEALVLAGLIGVQCGCGESPEITPAAQPIAWTVDSIPAADIGGADSGGPYDFHQVFSALRLADGRLGVANSATGQIRFFDSTGRFETAAGRRGKGPGEYTWLIHLFRFRGDSLAAFDAGSLRWSILDRVGRFGRAITIDGNSIYAMVGTWLVQFGMIRETELPSDPGRRSTADTVAGAAAAEASAAFIEGFLDREGALWFEGPGGRWQVLAKPGTGLASVALPLGFTPLDADLDHVLGVRRDADDLEHLMLLRLRRSVPPARRSAPTALAGPAPSPDVANRLRTELSDLLMAQERHYAGHGSYAVAPDSLAWKATGPHDLFLLHGNARTWVGAVRDRVTGAVCAIGLGESLPAGWVDGAIQCR